MEYLNWHGCYKRRWGTDLIPSAYAHPAKVARELARRIYEYLHEEGYIVPGSTIVDPFAGIGGFALDAMRHGCHFIGSELEQKFVDEGAGYDCPGFSKSEWKRYQHRIGRVNYRHNIHYCSDCAKAMQEIGESRIIPNRYAHRYQGNIDLWNDRYKPLWPDTWGTAVLLQGDSRELGRVLREAGGLVSSPPFAEAQTGGTAIWSQLEISHNRIFTERSKRGGYVATYHGTHPSNLGNMRASDQGLDAVVSSPPYSQTLKGGEGPGARYDFKTHSPDNAVRQTCDPDYGADPANLANLPEGDGEAVISSPPYAAGCSHTGGETSPTTGQGGPIRFVEYGESDVQLAAMPEGDLDAVVTSPPFGAGETRDRAPVQPGHVADCMTRSYTQDKQGTTPGNLATMDACVSSPPFMDQSPSHDKAENYQGFEHVGSIKAGAVGYGYNSENPANIGNDTGNDFWTAARAIVHQCHVILEPGAVAVWVVKRFVRNKQIVDFPGQWEQMCEAAGFETVERIRAWLVEDRGTQIDLFGNDHQQTVSRKSFFRRLYESKYPENSIDYEDVIIMRKSQLLSAAKGETTP